MKVSIQLFSARNFLPWEDVLKTCANIGYERVEGFDYVFEDVETFAKALRDNKLTMPSCHFALASLENDLDKCLSIAETIGIRFMISPWLDPQDRPTTKAGWEAFAMRLANVGKAVETAGFKFAWHNHDYEFVPVEDGTIPMDIILQTASDINWQADIAWIIKGNQNPLDWIEKYGQRICAVHAKDIAPDGECTDEDGWCDFGSGVMPWKDLLDAIATHTNAQVFAMEHDNPNDFLRFASRSYASLRKLENA